MKKYFILVLFVAAASLSRGSKLPPPSLDVMLKDTLGSVHIGEEAMLKLTESQGNLLVVELFVKQKLVLLDSTRASTCQGWYCCIEKSSMNIWFWSSDVGGHLWKLNSAGIYEKKGLKEVVSEMPAEFWNALPSSLKKKWKSLRL